MKKFFASLLACAVVCAFTVGMSACEEEEKKEEHVHSYGAWTTVKEATLFEEGSEERVCAGDATHKETRAIAAEGTTAAVKDYFVMYADACTAGEDGIILNEDTENGTGASTYFGEEDKNYDWDGEEVTLKFDLDLSALTDVDDYTAWVLGFNSKVDDAYTHIDEIRFGVVKTEGGFVVGEMTGIGYDENENNNIVEIKKSDKTFTESEVTAEFTAAFDAETMEFTYSIKVGGVVVTEDASRTESAEIVGLRYLWNAGLNQDGVVLSNLVKA